MRDVVCPASILSLTIALGLLTAQQFSAPELARERMLVVVPMVGKGTAEDPRRPFGLPANTVNAAEPVGFRYLLADDGKTAIVLLSAAQRAHIDSLLVNSGLVNAGSPTQVVNAFSGVQLFDPKLHDHATVEAALKLLRKDFNLDAFAGNAPFLAGKL